MAAHNDLYNFSSREIQFPLLTIVDTSHVCGTHSGKTLRNMFFFFFRKKQRREREGEIRKNVKFEGEDNGDMELRW